MSEGRIEIRRCQLCGGERSEELFREDPYEVLRCRDCSMVWVTPRWDDSKLAEVYGEEYWQSDCPRSKGYADYAADSELYLKTFRRRMRLVEKHIEPGSKILDVGCAAGFFLQVAQERGHEVFGVELSAAIGAQAKERIGADRVHIGTLDSLPPEAVPEGGFDLITMWDVVEHVPDPQALLAEARRLLRPNGMLLVETQNITSRFAGLLGRRWHHFKHEEHIYHFNPETIAKLLEQSGFAQESWTASFGGKYVSFGFIAERASRLGALGLLFKPLNVLRKASLYVNLRDEMVVLARAGAQT